VERFGLAVIGTGAWGVTLAAHVASRGVPVALVARTRLEAEALSRARCSPRMSSAPFPPNLQVTADLSEALAGTPVVMLVVPSQTMRQNVRVLRDMVHPDVILVSASKGLEIGTTLRMTQVIAQEVGGRLPVHHICALSGPNLAREVAERKFSSTVVAAEDLHLARQVQELLAGPHFRVYSQTDVIGVELGGALKNIIALGTGMCDGLQAGDNGKAALMTRGLAEMARLGKALGAEPLTFSGLAGLGDLIATCTSPLSRNRTVGERLAHGQTLAEIQGSMQQVAEGVLTTKAARELARKYGVEMPITELMHRVLFEGLTPAEAGWALMQRDPKRELEGIL
jgi:glycerol-3-phosphate dehydrogenase (NAD(P)+)